MRALIASVGRPYSPILAISLRLGECCLPTDMGIQATAWHIPCIWIPTSSVLDLDNTCSGATPTGVLPVCLQKGALEPISSGAPRASFSLSKPGISNNHCSQLASALEYRCYASSGTYTSLCRSDSELLATGTVGRLTRNNNLIQVAPVND